ncbi:N-acetyl-gamma-glutamyl-phosphate reductase [Saccharothrix luteola]|uniref:N-acetyl-gamma-glutamyl-phosphate reductase n=1 Tax=Saccharothrix luteola TaxID=2893018 RepID=UPI001E316A99|nr:N-acetyl-gamma-glutamyl-phosphate reductase [Saccharothrix luteola]MCC8250101.1 N-acetyl-gamma-glutamyl-phosphate reductase [Saccharothrix luteola]
MRTATSAGRRPVGGLTAGVVGASGHAGGELCRLLLGHPEVATILPTSRGDRAFDAVHPNLLGAGLAFLDEGGLRDRAESLDVVFFCTPTGEAMRQARHYLERDVLVVDLSADFRFRDPAAFQQAHGRAHTDPELLSEAVYGLTELRREEIANARLIANPGCYAITAVLALTPLLRTGWWRRDAPVSVHAVNGSTGAGSEPKTAVMHAEMTASMLSYQLSGHRHAPELEEFFAAETGEPVVVDLNTAHGDFARGIHLQANVHLAEGVSREDLLARYVDAYGAGHDGEHFVLVNTRPKVGARDEKQYDLYPRLGSVVGSNFCHLGVDVDPERRIAKVVAVTDNLVKGAAGSAVQNMNAALGLPETTGLRAYAL